MKCRKIIERIDVRAHLNRHAVCGLRFKRHFLPHDIFFVGDFFLQRAVCFKSFGGRAKNNAPFFSIDDNGDISRFFE